MRRYLTLAATLFFAACASSPTVETSVGVESGSLSSEHEGEQLLLTLQKITLHVADSDCDENAADESCVPKEDSFIAVFEGEETLDLFSPGNASTLLSDATIPAGKITQIRLFFSGATWVKDGVSLPVLCSSCEETGLKLVTSGQVEAQEGEVLSLELLFDAELSLRFSPTEARLAPVVHLQANRQDE